LQVQESHRVATENTAKLFGACPLKPCVECIFGIELWKRINITLGRVSLLIFVLVADSGRGFTKKD
jgi:hypothetical protein